MAPNILTGIDVSCYLLRMDTSTTSRPLTLHDAQPDETCCVRQGDGLVAPEYALREAGELADLLKALADPTRLRMLALLAQRNAPLCVCEITERFPQNQPTISHHLRILREAGLAACEKRGVWAYHWATDAGRRAMSIVETLR